MKLLSDKNCPHCNKELFAEAEKSSGMEGIVIKNIKLVFLSQSGSVFVKCKSCKNPVPVPFLSFDKKS